MINLLKRFEIWLLIALVVAAVLWAFNADPNPVSSGAAVSQEELAAKTPLDIEGDSALLEIQNIQYRPDKGGGVVELTLLGKSGTEQQVALNEENVEMLTSEGEVIRPFYTPFLVDPILEPEEASQVTLRYWLLEPVEVLWLTYRDQTFKVVLPSV